jgi:hypothetical protein
MERMIDAYNTVRNCNNLFIILVLCIKHYNSNIPVWGSDMFFDETYANGDGTDSWCTTNEQLPLEMHYLHVYPEPKCDVWSCGIGHLERLVDADYYCVRNREDSSSSCTDRTKIHDVPMYFLCM